MVFFSHLDQISMFIDSHAHLTSDALFCDIQEILERAKKMNVSKIINICTDLTTLQRGIELSKDYSWVYQAGATTPHDVDKEGEAYFQYFEQAAASGQLIAIGETGLDYFYTHSSKNTQRDFFIRYIELAIQFHLPLIIHCRDAFEDFFAIIDQHYKKEKAGVLHCFTGTLKDAKKLIERGWFLSWSGIITFKKSTELQEIARWAPLEHILIETDAPYLAPQNKRGKRNEPAFLPETAEVIAQLKGLPLQEVAQQAFQNTLELFKLRR